MDAIGRLKGDCFGGNGIDRFKGTKSTPVIGFFAGMLSTAL